MREDKKTWYESGILRIAAIVSALALVFTNIHHIINSTSSITSAYLKVLLAGLNIMVPIIFLMRSDKVSMLFFDDSRNGKLNYCRLLNISMDESSKEDVIAKAEYNNKRVRLLVNQLNTNVFWHVFFLIIVYLIYIADSIYIVDSDKNPYHSYFKIAVDLLNYLSSVFIYLNFKVLNGKTLDDDNGRIIYFTDAIIFSAFYFLSYAFFVIARFPIIPDNINAVDRSMVNGVQTDIVARIFSLFSGFFNGLAMALLFGKYILMEHSVSYTNRIKYNGLVSLGALFILPIYALVQLLYGSFDLNAFGDPVMFSNWVIFVCLIGKVFFLYVTSFFLKNKLMHLYLHLVITRGGIANKFDKCFKL